MENYKIQKRVLKICMAIAGVLILWCGFCAVNYAIKGAYNSAFFEVALILANLAWLVFYSAELRNISLLKLNDCKDKLLAKMEDRNMLVEHLYKMQQKIVADCHEKKKEILDEIEELSDSSMVYGLKDEHYVNFINLKNKAIKEVLRKAGYYDAK